MGRWALLVEPDSPINGTRTRLRTRVGATRLFEWKAKLWRACSPPSLKTGLRVLAKSCRVRSSFHFPKNVSKGLQRASPSLKWLSVVALRWDVRHGPASFFRLFLHRPRKAFALRLLTFFRIAALGPKCCAPCVRGEYASES